MRSVAGRLGLLLPAAATLLAAAPAPIPLPEHAFPESVSITRDGTAYVSGAAGGVLRVSLKTGTVERWIAPGAAGMGGLFGVLADRRNHMLWACSNDFAARGVPVPGQDSVPALKGFDLATGTPRISLPLPGEKAVCNDIAVAPDGSVYATDTAGSAVLRWRPGARALETWSKDPVLAAPKGGGLDGIAIAGDGAVIVTNVRTGGVFRIARGPGGAAGAITPLAPSEPLKGPDGLRAIGGGAYLLADNGGRLFRMTIEGDAARLVPLADVAATSADIWRGQAWHVVAQLGALFNPANAGKPAPAFALTPVPLAR